MIRHLNSGSENLTLVKHTGTEKVQESGHSALIQIIRNIRGKKMKYIRFTIILITILMVAGCKTFVAGPGGRREPSFG